MPFTFPKRNVGRLFVMPAVGVRQMLDRMPQGALRPPTEQLVNAYGATLSRREALAGDQTKTEAGRTVAQSREAHRLFVPSIEALHQARMVAVAARMDAAKRMSKLFDPENNPTSYESALIAHELRYKLAGMEPGQLQVVLSRAIEDGDKTLLRAVAVAPAWLFDLPTKAAMAGEKTIHEQVRDRLVSLDPEAAAARDVVRDIDGQIEAASQIEAATTQSIANAIDFDAARNFESIAQAAAA